jgi:DNA-binding XRE family transcriptional regulator
MGGYYKIGRTGNLKERLRILNNWAEPPKLLHAIQSLQDSIVERVIQRRFAHRHVRGEWYSLTDEDVRLFCSVSVCDRVDDLPEHLKPEAGSPNDFGRRLTVLRERAGLSKDALAKKTRCSGYLLSRLERGLEQPTIKVVRRLTTVLGAVLSSVADVEPVEAKLRGRPRKGARSD